MSRQARTTIVAKLNCRSESNHAPKSVYIRLVEALAKVLASRRINVQSAPEIHDPKANWFSVVAELVERHYQLYAHIPRTDTHIHTYTHTRPLTHTRTLGSLTQSRVVVCDEVDSFPTETVLTLLEPMSRHQHVLIIGASTTVPPAVTLIAVPPQASLIVSIWALRSARTHACTTLNSSNTTPTLPRRWPALLGMIALS